MAKSPRKGNVSHGKAKAKSQNPKLTGSPIKSKGGKNIKKLTTKRSRRFSLVSDSESESEDYGDDDDDDEANDDLSDMDEDMDNFGGPVTAITSSSEDDDDDDDEDSGSDDYVDDDFYKNKKFAQKLRRSESAVISSESEDNNSSSSDDENINFVQLTKERRARALKAAKGLKGPRKSTKKQQEQEKEKEKEKEKSKTKKKQSHKEDYKSSPVSKEQIILDDDNDDDDDDKVAVAEKDIDFHFDFDNDGNETFHVGPKVEKKAEQPLGDEDIGEAIEMDGIPTNTVVSNEKVVLDVPKIDENDIDSDADYEFDKNELIQALQEDNDDLELNAFGNSDDDYDFLLPDDDPFYKDDDDNYLLKQETEALVDDYQDYSSSANVTPRHSIVAMENTTPLPGEVNNSVIVKKDNSKKEKEKEKEDVKGTAASHGKYYDEDDYDDDEDEQSDFDISVYDEMFESNSYPASLVSPDQGGANNYLFADTDDNGDDDDDYDDEYDDSHLIPYFFSSDEGSDDSDNDKVEESGDETDEDTTIPTKSAKQIGSKVAKEVLSSSKNNFRAPVLGTFNTLKNKKPYSIIDGYSTRFLQPLQTPNSGMSVLKGSLSMMKSNRFQPVVGSNTNTNSAASPAMELDELLNISDLEEDEDNSIPANFDWGFNDRRIPLSAFRNKGIINNVYYNNYDIAKKPSVLDSSTWNGRSSKHHRKKDKKAKLKQKNGAIEGSVAVAGFKSTKASKLSPATLKNSKKLTKSRMRRQSVAEAHSEGLRTTKSGLFSEEALQDVEAFLVDIGSNDDLSFLYSEV